jgi:hypothetical protein
MSVSWSESPIGRSTRNDLNRDRPVTYTLRVQDLAVELENMNQSMNTADYTSILA